MHCTVGLNSDVPVPRKVCALITSALTNAVAHAGLDPCTTVKNFETFVVYIYKIQPDQFAKVIILFRKQTPHRVHFTKIEHNGHYRLET